ncbi:hypothetical protein OGAPHI_000858 [Ogataea philodendri]|uniref:Uncharacterized protein n=1 Tax=Ogataea philodendri TaxID=1378263 RepID=A0A9P8PFL2_9ASCO|nr:uncharacterized protein OGAPHI_000858 [Ogataea philodendri]KAH3671147.1 hypothetical protein OGAPHI_000858 [Ogataea philodendri]
MHDLGNQLGQNTFSIVGDLTQLNVRFNTRVDVVLINILLDEMEFLSVWEIQGTASSELGLGVWDGLMELGGNKLVDMRCFVSGVISDNEHFNKTDAK